MSNKPETEAAAVAQGIADADKFLRRVQEAAHEAFGMPDPNTVSNGASGDLHEDGTPAKPKIGEPKHKRFDF